MLQIRRFAAVVACALAAPVVAQDTPARQPPLTKEQERERFHPRALGMEAAPRLAGYARRLEMERSVYSLPPRLSGGTAS